MGHVSYSTATVMVRGHDFSADYVPGIPGEQPVIIRLGLPGYPDNVLDIINDDTLGLIRVECAKRLRDELAFIARVLEQERSEP